MIYALTHGDRLTGVNPSHTEAGIARIKEIILPRSISLVVVGTGKRFQEIYQALKGAGQISPHIKVVYSPFCGSADGLDPGNKVVLADGTMVNLDTEYIGLASRLSGFSPWVFFEKLEVSTADDVLLCTGAELLLSAGCAKPERGCLYKIGWSTRSIERA